MSPSFFPCVCLDARQPPTRLNQLPAHPTPTTKLMVRFLDLPREVRDMIYVQYVSIEGGYIHDFDSNTLKGADNTSIHLAFMLTCKKVAREMKGLALSSNSIYFSTSHSAEHQATAGRFDLLVDELAFARGLLIDRIHSDTLSVPHDMWKRLKEAHPRFAPYLDFLQNRRTFREYRENPISDDLGPPGCCGEAPSVFRNFVDAVLQDIAANKHRFDAEQLTKFETAEFGPPPPGTLSTLKWGLYST
ncbi:hypothetical protein CSUB01_08675 [Colletotrichum sublineola]|uniref:Uncharacterized protein n=1 Tax=Colletotrichum sublineola TaxID=1173701 RepID=A0A066XFK2_COLSU|nr:hypothetical protein CSUB01_08675 [Colletotrichum sublineola]